MSRKWCQIEPTLKVNGNNFNVQVGIFGEITDIVAAMDGAPTDVDVYLKTNTSHSTVDVDTGFNGEGWAIHFHWDATITDPNRVKVKARLHMNNPDPYDGTAWDFQVQVTPWDPNLGSAFVYGTVPNYSALANLQIGQ